MSKKDLYESFNEIEFDFDNLPEADIDELEKKRILKSTKSRLNLSKSSRPQKRMKVKIAAAVAAAVIIIVGSSPFGRNVLADVGRKLFFTPSYGVQDGTDLGETYILKNPFRINISGEEYLIKSVISSKGGIVIQLNGSSYDDNIKTEEDKELYSDEMDKKCQELKNNIKIKAEDGTVLAADSMSSASGGFYWLGFPKTDNVINRFALYFDENKLADIELSNVDYAESSEELGGSSLSSGFQVGATDYYQEGERYFKLWSPVEFERNGDYQIMFYGIGEKEITVTDENGNALAFENDQDGSGKAYKLLSTYDGPINIHLSDISVSYNFYDKTATISTELPDDNKSIELNKEISFPYIKDTVMLQKISESGGTYTLSFDFSQNYDKNRTIYMLTPGLRSSGGMGDSENMSGEIYLDNEDLTMSEKLLKALNLKLHNIEMNISGDWNITID